MSELRPRPVMSQPLESAQRHILSITLEDYFHGPAFRKRIGQKQWGRFEQRFEENCQHVLGRLAGAGSTATFFVNPWIAEQRSDLVQEVIRQGHEIALAGPRGGSFRCHTRASLREQVRNGRDVVERASGRQVLGYRVSDVLLAPHDLWALPILAEEGFAYDSSVSPLGRQFARERRQYIHRAADVSRPFWEVPLTSLWLGPWLVPMAGGNYFRQAPEWFVRAALRRRVEHTQEPLVLYFRLWDFDPAQPRMQTGSLVGDLRHYRNGDRMVATLQHLLATYRFSSIAEHLELKQKPVTRSPASACSPVAAAPAPLGERPQVSLIIPCFNEEATIPYLSKTMHEVRHALADRWDVQWILVDDGSRDETWFRLRSEFRHSPDVLLLRHERNQGVAAAIHSGLLHARELACSMDCDCSYDPLEVLPMLALMKEGVDLVTASPYHPEGAVLNVPKWRLALSRGASVLYRAVTGYRLYTFTACLRVYRRSIALQVPVASRGFLGVAELAGRMALERRLIVEYPATLESRIFGRSKMKVARTVVGHLGLLSRLLCQRIRSGRTAAGSVHLPEAVRLEQDQSNVAREILL